MRGQTASFALSAGLTAVKDPWYEKVSNKLTPHDCITQSLETLHNLLLEKESFFLRFKQWSECSAGLSL